MDPEYSTAQRIAALAGVLFAVVMLAASLDVALGGRLTRPARLRYIWADATAPAPEVAADDSDSGVA